MASCKQVDSLIQAYIDDELGVSERAIFEQHLSECRQCKAAEARQRAGAALLFEAFEPHRLDHDMTASVMAHLPDLEDSRRLREFNQRAKNPRSRWAGLLTWGPALAPVLMLMLAFALWYSWPTSQAYIGVTVGMVTAKDGELLSKHDQSYDNWRRAALEETVSKGDRVETMAGSRAMISLAGPTTLKMGENTSIQVRDSRTLSMDRGIIWLSVNKAPRKFRIETPAGDVTVFGTVFQVEANDFETVVTLEEGSVTVGNDLDFVMLDPNEQVRVVRGEQISKPQRVDANLILSWADSIQPHADAMVLFARAITPLPPGLIPAEQFYRCDTRNQGLPSHFKFEWKTDNKLSGHCSYDIYVYDEEWEPLFKVGPVSGKVFADKDHNSLQLALPEGESIANRVIYLKLVPDDRSGMLETNFEAVSAVVAEAGA